MTDFYKYSATGNDFIIIDNRQENFQADNSAFWQKLCARRTGIGADGALLLEESEKADFKMRYINSDGSIASMCGNGARAIVHFAHHVLNLKEELLYLFETDNNLYNAEINGNEIKLSMTEINDIGKIDLSCFKEYEHSLYLNTGVPHVVFHVKNVVDNHEILKKSANIAHHELFKNGVNVNFFSVISQGKIRLRTYERGVEDETLSCGTGATASAIACTHFFGWKDSIEVCTSGGKLEIIFDENFKNVCLRGKAELIYQGHF